jgi:hypothetical protein
MTQDQLDPVAGMMIDAYLATAEFRHSFAADFGGFPPSLSARAHHMRSVMQAKLNEDDRYALHASYAEFGRVQFDDREHDQVYLLRSRSAVSIDRFKAQREQLFDSIEYLKSEVVLVVYEFTAGDLSLSVTGTRHLADSKRLEPTAEPTFVGCWPFTPTESLAFDQDERDHFGELDQSEDGAGEGDPS